MTGVTRYYGRRPINGLRRAKLKWVTNKQPLPFGYESTGVITRYTDRRDPKPRSR